MDFINQGGFRFSIRGPFVCKFLGDRYAWYAPKLLDYFNSERCTEFVSKEIRLGDYLSSIEAPENLLVVVIHTSAYTMNLEDRDQHVYNFRKEATNNTWLRMDDTFNKPKDIDNE